MMSQASASTSGGRRSSFDEVRSNSLSGRRATINRNLSEGWMSGNRLWSSWKRNSNRPWAPGGSTPAGPSLLIARNWARGVGGIGGGGGGNGGTINTAPEPPPPPPPPPPPCTTRGIRGGGGWGVTLACSLAMITTGAGMSVSPSLVYSTTNGASRNAGKTNAGSTKRAVKWPGLPVVTVKASSATAELDTLVALTSYKPGVSPTRSNVTKNVVDACTVRARAIVIETLDDATTKCIVGTVGLL